MRWHYNDEDWVLKDVSFRVASGESIAIVGHTGAGKTTVTGLLTRFYDVQKGRILIDGADVSALALEDLRRRFAVVLQDVFMFSGTLESNIRLGSDIPAERVLRAAQDVNLGPFLRSLELGLEHPVNERGTTLSVGQRQLLAFARALAHDPEILILDEATSSVDTETEIAIRQAIDRLMSGRTSIIIAHRLSTIQRCDRIIVMHKGEKFARSVRTRSCWPSAVSTTSCISSSTRTRSSCPSRRHRGDRDIDQLRQNRKRYRPGNPCSV